MDGRNKRKFDDFENQSTQNITDPTPRSHLNETVGEYVEGSIVRIKLINFVTYSEVEFQPGPRLNVIIGPNGSGKSSIVCAIALGLGGGTNLLGRAKQVSDYIKHGCDRAVIEIELYQKKQNMIVRRDIYRDNTGEFRLNGKTISKTDVLAKIKELSVQVDNLCQFLPQDKVVCFAAMTPTELLIETEKAININDMYENHMKLIDLRKEHSLFQNSFSEQNSILEDLKKQNASLEKDVKKFKEKQEYEQRAKDLQNKRLWIEFEECRERVLAVKNEKESLQKELHKLELERKQPMQSLQALERSIEESRNKVTQLGAKVTQLETLIQRKNQGREKNNLAIEALDNEWDGLNNRAEQRGTEIRSLERQKEECQNRLTVLPDENSLKAKITEMNSLLKDLNQSIGEFQFERNSLNQQKHELEKEYNIVRHELESINNKTAVRLEMVRKSNPEVFQAYNFVKENSSIFQRQVFGPVCCEINVENDDHAKYLEYSIPHWLLMGFVFQCKEDRELFLKELVDKRKLALNAVFLPNKVNFQREFELNQLDRKFGVTHYLDQTFETSPTVRDALMENTPLYNMAAGSRETTKYEVEIIENTPVPILFTPAKNLSKTRSKYGDRNIMTKITNLRQTKYLAGVNLQKKEELLEKQKEIQEKIQIIQEKIQDTSDKENAVKYKSKDYLESRNTSNSTLEERKKLYSKIGFVEKKIAALSEEEDLESSKQRIKTNIMDTIHKNVALVNESTKDLMDMCKVFVERDQIFIRQSKEECRLRFEQEKSRELERKIEEAQRSLKEATNEFNELAKDAKSKKQIAEKAAPVQTDEALKKLLFEEIEEDTLEAIDQAINHFQNKARFITSSNPRVVQDYENRCKEIEKLEDRLNNQNRSLESMNQQMEKLKQEWLTPVKSFIEKINTRFTGYFEHIGCNGEVKLGFDVNDPEDFSKYSIDIWVKFRENEVLKKLDAHVQSGGERSVSTMLFLISLQELTDCPFRVVDEINQGMDPNNERMIFSQIVKTANRPGLPQYFLITPKLLQNLEYSDNTTVLCVFTGPWSLTQKELEESLHTTINNKSQMSNNNRNTNGNGNKQHRY